MAIYSLYQFTKPEKALKNTVISLTNNFQLGIVDISNELAALWKIFF